MTPTKFLIGQILIVLLVVVVGVWAGTQCAALQLGFQAGLGEPWFLFFGVPVYRPWQLFVWWYFFDAYAPEVFFRSGVVAACSGFLGCLAAIFGSLWRARQSHHVTTHGSARWAKLIEIVRIWITRR